MPLYRVDAKSDKVKIVEIIFLWLLELYHEDTIQVGNERFKLTRMYMYVFWPSLCQKLNLVRERINN